MWPLAVCNEIWRDLPAERVFERAARLGYEGVEIAPFTIAESVQRIPADRRAALRRAAADAGVRIVGLHWLFVSPDGLHLTSPDAAVRRRSGDYLRALADFCADLGGTIMVFGSPKQRSFHPPDTYNDAFVRAADLLHDVAATLRAQGVTLCVEALMPTETNFINTACQAAALADAVGVPEAVDIMLDVKALSAMPGGIEANLACFGSRAKHLHANDPSGKGPGMGDLDFVPVLRAAKQAGYRGWISVEPFEYELDPDTVARTAIETLKAAMAEL